MGSIGPAEILVVLVVALIVLGPSRLPSAARSVGKAVGEFRRYSTQFQAELRDGFAEPEPSFPASAPDAPVPDGPRPERAGQGSAPEEPSTS